MERKVYSTFQRIAYLYARANADMGVGPCSLVHFLVVRTYTHFHRCTSNPMREYETTVAREYSCASMQLGSVIIYYSMLFNSCLFFLAIETADVNG